MRQRSQLQLYMRPASPETKFSDELLSTARILSEAPGMSEVFARAQQDLGYSPRQIGREGMTVEQVIRAGIVRIRLGLSYRELSHATQDSLSVREFLGLGYGGGFQKSSLQSNIKRIKYSTWQALNDCLKTYARERDIEDGEKIRTDTTGCETNIHYPTDGSLLNDSVRVLTRVMSYALEFGEVPIQFMNHYRAVKKKVFKLNNTSKRDKRRELYLQLLRLSRNTLHYAVTALDVLSAHDSITTPAQSVAIKRAIDDLEHYTPLVTQIIDQAYRRLINGEKLRANEKIVSLFEPHTDILVKGPREVAFGHKLCITEGASSLILDVKVLDGNPADSELVPEVFDRHKEFYNAPPSEAVFDGCFASLANRDYAKNMGVKELTFSKHRSLDINSFVSSRKVQTKLRKFRAGIEACISFMKRIFGWKRIFDKGKESFHATVQAAVIAYNLTVLSRL